MTQDGKVIDKFDGTKNEFLSNFYVAPFKWKGFTADTVEHAYQAEKTLDMDEFACIITSPRPGIAKRFGSAVKELRPDWETYKFELMHDLLMVKFSKPILGRLLLNTGEATLIEGNTWHDQCWGDCRCGRARCALPGRNMLGEILMEVRHRISDLSFIPPLGEVLGKFKEST